MGSGLIVLVSSLDEGGIQQAMRGERKSRGCEDFDERAGEALPDCVTPAQKNKAAGGV
jgi:hypothetical protein